MAIVFASTTGASLRIGLRHPALESARDGGRDDGGRLAIVGGATAAIEVRAADRDQNAPSVDAVAGCEFVDDRIRLLENDLPRSGTTDLESQFPE